MADHVWAGYAHPHALGTPEWKLCYAPRARPKQGRRSDGADGPSLVPARYGRIVHAWAELLYSVCTW